MLLRKCPRPLTVVEQLLHGEELSRHEQALVAIARRSASNKSRLRGP